MTSDLVLQSLEMAIEKTADTPSEGDIAPACYARFFEMSPESAELMCHMDPIQHGNMMAEIFRLMMLSDYSSEQQYFNWEVENHNNAYSVLPDMYNTLLDSLISVVAEILGDDWNERYQLAWQSRSELLLKEIKQRC